MCDHQSNGYLALNAPSFAGAGGFTGDTGATGQTGVTGGWTLPPSHEVASGVMPWKCAITTSDGQSALNTPLLAGASGFTGDSGATGRTGVTGGWTLPPSHEVASSVMPWKCAITTNDGQSALNTQLLAGASGFTGDTGATGQTGVTGGWTLLPLPSIRICLSFGCV